MQKYLVGLMVILLLSVGGCVLPKEVRVLDSIQRDIGYEKYEEALSKINKFEQTYPNVPLWVPMHLVEMRAETYDKQKKTAEAIKELETLLEKNPYCPGWIYCQLAKFYLKEGRTKEAEKTFDKMKRLSTMDLTIDIAQTYEDNKLLEEAERVYSQLLVDFPDYYRIYTRLGDVYRKMGQVNQAMKNYTKALELYPKEIEALRWMGGLYVVAGEKEKARQTFQEAIKFSFDEEETKLDQAICFYIDSPSYDKIINTLKIDMTDGDLKKAVESLHRRLKEKPQSLDIHFGLVAIYTLMEMEEETKKEIKEILHIAPHSKEAKLGKMLIEHIY